MSEHITEWLNAYLDGELHGRRLDQVEEHLAGCETCQAEMQSLETLSGLLHEVPAPEFTSPERFASRVSLRLPPRQTSSPRRAVLEIGWWMIPAGLLAAWIFIGTTILVSDVVSTANRLGLLGGLSDRLVTVPLSDTYWSATLGQMGFLSGNTLDWAEATEAFTRNILPQITVQVSIALLYLSWIAIWWAHHRREGQGRLLEG